MATRLRKDGTRFAYTATKNLPLLDAVMRAHLPAYVATVVRDYAGLQKGETWELREGTFDMDSTDQEIVCARGSVCECLVRGAEGWLRIGKSRGMSFFPLHPKPDSDESLANVHNSRWAGVSLWIVERTARRSIIVWQIKAIRIESDGSS
jgi:hypothetical protein